MIEWHKNFRKTMEIRLIYYLKHVRREKGYVHSEHRHLRLAHEFVFVDYGKLEVILAGISYSLNTGDCILIPGGTPHFYAGSRTMPCSYLNVLFRGTLPEALFSRVVTVSQPARQCIARMTEEMSIRSARQVELLLCRFTELMILLSPEQEISEASQVKCEETEPFLPGSGCRYNSDLVRRAVEIIRRDYYSPLDMKVLSESLNVSKSHLRALLRKETGKNFTRLLHEARIDVAKKMLQESTMNLNEIAQAVGYGSSFFFTVFKQVTGMTPHAYSSTLRMDNFSSEVAYQSQ